MVEHLQATGRPPIRRVLIPHRLGDYRSKNPYLQRLVTSYESCGVKVWCDHEGLFRSDSIVDLIHLHWPEHIARLIRGWHTEDAHAFILRRLRVWSARARIIWTMHNDRPHRVAEWQRGGRPYQEYLDVVDGLVHHCHASRSVLASRYRIPGGVSHLVVPHGNLVYEGSHTSRAEARRTLRIPADRLVFLFVGQLHVHKGFGTVLEGFKRYCKRRLGPRALLLVCGWDRPVAYRGKARGYLSHWRWFLHEGWRVWACSEGPVIAHLGLKSERDIAVFSSAADIAVLGHKHVLTSGVAALAATHGLALVAPDMGCMREQSSPAGRVLYQTGDPDALAEAMGRSAGLDLHEVARTQQALAQTWDWESGTRRLLAWAAGLGGRPGQQNAVFGGAGREG